MLPRHPLSTLFPYTTLFRSDPQLRRIRSYRYLSRRGELSKRLRALHRDHPERRLAHRVRRRCPRERAREERSEEHTSELQSRGHLVCRLLLEKKKTQEYKDS